MKLWKKYIGVFAVLAFILGGFSGISDAALICGHGKPAAETAIQADNPLRNDCHAGAQKTGDRKKTGKEQGCCDSSCDGMGCGQMPVMIPFEALRINIPVMSGYEVFDLSSGGTRLEKLMRPPILR